MTERKEYRLVRVDSGTDWVAYKVIRLQEETDVMDSYREAYEEAFLNKNRRLVDKKTLGAFFR